MTEEIMLVAALALSVLNFILSLARYGKVKKEISAILRHLLATAYFEER